MMSIEERLPIIEKLVKAGYKTAEICCYLGMRSGTVSDDKVRRLGLKGFKGPTPNESIEDFMSDKNATKTHNQLWRIANYGYRESRCN